MIFIVIPVFNKIKFTLNCIKTLMQQSFKNFTIILIDDGSTDGTSEIITQNFKDVIIMKGDGNLWWANATNLGVKYALNVSTSINDDFILTLNNDLEVPIDYLKNIYANVLLYPNSIIGSVGVNIKNPEFMEYCGVKWNQFNAKQYSLSKKYNHSYSLFKSKSQIIESDFLSGRGTLIPLGLFKKIGLYDSVNFPQYAADNDFSLRARKYGCKLLIHPDIYVLSHINETGTNLINVKYRFMDIKKLFFSIKSPLNVKIRYRFAMKNTRLQFIYFLLDMSRITISFFMGYFKSIIKKEN
jgi:GT2 family glycosyltransferase